MILKTRFTRVVKFKMIDFKYHSATKKAKVELTRNIHLIVSKTLSGVVDDN